MCVSEVVVDCYSSIIPGTPVVHGSQDVVIIQTKKLAKFFSHYRGVQVLFQVVIKESGLVCNFL